MDDARPGAPGHRVRRDPTSLGPVNIMREKVYRDKVESLLVRSERKRKDGPQCLPFFFLLLELKGLEEPLFYKRGSF